MGNPDRSTMSDTQTALNGYVVAARPVVDQHILRVRRIGKRLFGAASCIVTFGELTDTFVENDRSGSSAEDAFCHSIPQPSGLLLVADTHKERSLCQHRLVAGAPFIRFYVSYPIYDQNHLPIGSISLIDYVPRSFSEEDLQLLIDLASLVERELHLRSMSVTQIDLEKKNKNLRRKSLIDPLIGTWNRGAIMRILSIEATRCSKMDAPLSLIVIDLDFFKKVNDTYGHPVGDTVLVKVASRLRSCIRPQEALGRYGGEEFLVVLPGSSHEVAMGVAERMRAAVAAQPEIIGELSISLTISAGVASSAVFPEASTDDLINHADIALYRAKDDGRNCVKGAPPALP